MNTSDLGDLTLQFFSIKDAYFRENGILKTMLRERGLSSSQLRAELRRRLKQQQVQETAVETLLKCARRIEAILDKDDELSERLTKTLAGNQKHKMN